MVVVNIGWLWGVAGGRKLAEGESFSWYNLLYSLNFEPREYFTDPKIKQDETENLLTVATGLSSLCAGNCQRNYLSPGHIDTAQFLNTTKFRNHPFGR